jgi:hypothetical protein
MRGRSLSLFGVGVFSLFLAGCANATNLPASASAPKAEPNTEPPTGVGNVVATAGSTGDASDEGMTPPASRSDVGASKETVLHEGDAPARMRPLRYVTTSSGLEIDVDGVHFVVTAAAVPIGRGWGVRVATKVRADHGKSYKLLTPKRGPFGFAGSVVRGGLSMPVFDSRDGSDTTTIGEEPVEFSRDWPGDSGEKPLGQADRLMLQVDLWGASGKIYDKMLPVKELFRVRATPDKGKFKVAVEQPVVE